jgi:hypothetical protein
MANIDIENVTNEQKTGIFDKIMRSINANIEQQYLNNRITGSDYATVYLGSIEAALSQSIQFSLQEDLVEAQVEGILADNQLKADQLLTSSVDRDIKLYELNNLLPEQLTKLQEEIDLLQTQDSEAQLDGTKKRLVMDEEIESANKQQLLADEQIKTTYTDRVLKDKQAAKLGMDNVMKISETARQGDATFVYVPKYQGA